MPSTAKTVGKKSETDFFRSRLLINFENTKIKIAGENSLTFPPNYDIVYIQRIQKEAKKEVVTRKEDTPQRIASRKYEAQQRKAQSGKREFSNDDPARLVRRNQRVFEKE